MASRLIDTNQGTFNLFIENEFSDMTRRTRKSYSVVGPDGRHFQAYDMDSLRRTMVRNYGFDSIAQVKRELF